jgi:hypothetical protein
MKVCDRHRDRAHADTLTSLRDGSSHDLCQDCLGFFSAWVISSAAENPLPPGYPKTIPESEQREKRGPGRTKGSKNKNGGH